MGDKKAQELSAETRLLAAITYGESSTKDDPDEMSAIASVLVRQRDARGYKDIMRFAVREKTFAFAVSDGNERYADLMKASEKSIERHPGMKIAIAAAVNALEGGVDKSNGAYFWDGADIKSNYKHHFKVKRGIKFTDPSHNIYGIQDSTKLEIKYRATKVKNTSTGKVSTALVEIGRYDHQYDSTAAYGGTIFWKFSPQFLEVTHGWEYK
ncbi:hypothetical protein GTP91_11465 [Rugamonas sp. FT82W]|uniref:Uncharacterized protein n=1 Tax=Duganella vulcania TaxID=2692166 RepID=A0A845G485_9BURK|nr:hypothetical protein [Duganella vulcania]MYM87797.1 hypothetical protein [Duganella vulcania]